MLERYRGTTTELEPFQTFRDLQREMNRLVSDFFSGVSVWGTYPPMTMVETTDDIIVYAELPGMDRNDFKVTLTDNVLSITGERKEEQLPEGARYLFNERTTGRFARDIRLPVDVDASKIKAEFKNGLLKVTLPKHEETKPKEITIQ